MFRLFLVLSFLCLPCFSAYRLQTLYTGFQIPVFVTHEPGRDKLYVVESLGTIKTFAKGKLGKRPFLNIRKKVAGGAELGLLHFAFHPKYSTNRRFFVYYITGKKQRYSILAEYKTGDIKERVILKYKQPGLDHNGGYIFFDKEGLLYLGTGNGSSEHKISKGNSQSLYTLLGKLLRINVDGKHPYEIPKSNPFYDTLGRKEIFAVGLRHPWRMSYDRLSETIWVGDNGELKREEIHIVEKGKNYGWSFMEGSLCFDPPKECPKKGLEAPIHEYGRKEGYSVIGGYVYRGRKIPELYGRYVFGDYGSGKIWALTIDIKKKKKIKNELLIDTPHQITSFGLDFEGELLLTTYEGGLFRLRKSEGKK